MRVGINSLHIRCPVADPHPTSPFQGEERTLPRGHAYAFRLPCDLPPKKWTGLSCF